MYYYRQTDNVLYEDVALELLDEVVKELRKDLPITFKSGLSGIEQANCPIVKEFYNREAEISLCLFEVSRHSNDTDIEDQAFNLLQEALADSKEDIGFEKGLSGIGYVVTYLVRNQFIETNFDEIFGVQLNKIIE